MNRKIFFILLISIHLTTCFANQADSLNSTSLHSFEILKLMNPWLNTENPAGLHFNHGILPAKINLYYGAENGDYKRVQQGDKLNYYSFQSEAYTKIKDIQFYGSFSYDKSLEKGLNYSNTNNPYRGTPYDYIDTIGGDTYNREFFYLNGALSKPVSESMVFGIAYDFGVGVSVQDRDPRPQNKVLDMELRPGFIYSLSNLKLGLNLIYQHYNEEIDVDIIDENSILTIFRILGPGVSFTHKATSFNRLYKRNGMGFDGQINYNKGNLNTLLGSKFIYFNESAQDGGKGGNASWNYLKNHSILKGIDWNIYANFQIKEGGKIQSVIANFNIITNQGIETLEKLEQVGILDSQDWVFYKDEPKYGSEFIDANLFYTFTKMESPVSENYSFSVKANYSSFEENYYIPFQSQHYENLKLGINASKSFRLKTSVLSMGAGINYKMNIGGEMDFENINFIYDKLLYPDYLFLTSNYYAPSIKISYEKQLNKLFNKIFINAKTELYKGDNGLSRYAASLSTGVIF